MSHLSDPSDRHSSFLAEQIELLRLGKLTHLQLTVCGSLRTAVGTPSPLYTAAW